LGQFGNITIPVTSGGLLEFTFGVGGTDGSTPTVATATTVTYNGTLVLTCNGATAGSGVNGGAGASLADGAFGSYSCGGGGGMDTAGLDSSNVRTGGAVSSSAFNGTASPGYDAGNSSN